MKTQEEINKSWENTYTGKGGMSLTLLQPPKRDSGLRKPYQYKLPGQQINKLIAKLKALEKA